MVTEWEWLREATRIVNQQRKQPGGQQQVPTKLQKKKGRRQGHPHPQSLLGPQQLLAARLCQWCPAAQHVYCPWRGSISPCRLAGGLVLGVTGVVNLWEGGSVALILPRSGAQ